MFCFQCEQTAGCGGCTGNAGVCGKKAETAHFQDKLTGALIGLAHATVGNEYMINDGTHALIREALFATVTNVGFSDAAIGEMLDRVAVEKARITPGCSACASPCGRTRDYDMNDLWQADADIRSLKSLILFGIRGMAAYAQHAAALGYTDAAVDGF